MKVTVILTSYNRPHLVRQAIESVRRQTHADWELIVVDDNSNPETQQALREAVGSDRRCRLLNSGVRPEDRPRSTRYASCINLGLGMATGDLVTYLTDDDIYMPDRLAAMVRVFETHPEIYVLYGQQRLVNLNPDGTLSPAGFRNSVGITRRPGGQVDHNSVMHRRACLEVVGGWDESPTQWLSADADFFNRLAAHWDFHPLNRITEEHRLHSASVQSRLSRGEPPVAEAAEPPLSPHSFPRDSASRMAAFQAWNRSRPKESVPRPPAKTTFFGR